MHFWFAALHRVSTNTHTHSRTPHGHASSLPLSSVADEIISELLWVAADSQREALIRAVSTLRCFDISCLFQQLETQEVTRT